MKQPKCECGRCKYCKKRAEYLRHKQSYILRSQQYQKENREQTNEKNSKWKRNNPDKVKAQSKIDSKNRRGTARGSVAYRKHDLKRHYGTTPEWCEAKLKEQDNKCPMCGVSLIGTRRPPVDHCHVTGWVRGIPCNLCNTALERLESIPDWEVRARAYLDRYEKEYWESVNARYGNRASGSSPVDS